MRHSVRILTLAAILVVLGVSAARTVSQAAEKPRRASGQNRLVVFETFMRPG
jgi:hypothetical protein